MGIRFASMAYNSARWGIARYLYTERRARRLPVQARHVDSAGDSVDPLDFVAGRNPDVGVELEANELFSLLAPQEQDMVERIVFDRENRDIIALDHGLTTDRLRKELAITLTFLRQKCE
jgi:hypothetical protein